MQERITFTGVFLSATLVVLALSCTSKSLTPDVNQSSTPSRSGESPGQVDSPQLQQCAQEYLSAEKREVDLNLKQGNGETICSLNSLSSLAKSCFTLGELEQTNAKKQWFEQGRHYAEILCREHPCQVEGHYWLALNLCGLSELIGAGNALLLLPTIVEHLETAVSLDKTYDQAGPLRALGWVQFRAPTWPLSEGDPVAALQHLRNAAEIAPDNITNHLYLGEALLEEGNKDEACRELQRAISSTQHSVSPCGFEGDRAEAYRLMEKCGR